MTREDEYRQLARVNTRAKFSDLCPFPFLVGVPALSRPHQPGRTVLVSPLDRDQLLAPRPKRMSPVDTGLIVLAVRKVQESFPSMITVGRTSNNDIVIEDVQVSKFHAFFRTSGDQLELSDAGSRNGTFVGSVRLEPKGPARPVQSGDQIRFGTLEFLFLDAGSTWDRIR